MIVFTASCDTDALLAARLRSKTGRWHGVLKPGAAFVVHADVYPSDKTAMKLVVFVNGFVSK